MQIYTKQGRRNLAMGQLPLKITIMPGSLASHFMPITRSASLYSSRFILL